MRKGKTIGFTLLLTLNLLTLVACTNNEVQRPLIQPAEFTFNGISVGSSMEDLLQQFGEPSGGGESADFDIIEFANSYFAHSLFLVADGYVIGYTVHGAAAGFHPLGISIGDSLEQTRQLLYNLGLPLITVNIVDAGDGTLPQSDPPLYSLQPSTAYLISVTDLGREDAPAETTIWIACDRQSLILVIQFRDDIIVSLQVSQM